MSEEAAAFARQDEVSEPFGFSDDAAPVDIAGKGDGPRDSGPQASIDPLAGAAFREPQGADFIAGEPPPLDALTASVLAPHSRNFLRMLIAALAQQATQPTEDVAGLGIVLSQIGWALSEGQAEAEALQELIETLNRQRVRPAALRDMVPIIAAFVARVTIGSRLHDDPPAAAADAADLVRSAEALVTAALEAGGVRAWRRLPEIAVAIARHVARRGLSIAALAEALPRLAARIGGGPRDAITSDRNHPRGHAPRGGAAGEPRRMLISGPVEIVILDR